MQEKQNKLTVMMRMMIAKATPSCDTMTQKMSEALDHKISLKDRLAIKLHNMGCMLCHRYRRQLVALEKLLEHYAQVSANNGVFADTTLPADSRQRIKQLLQEHNNH